VSHDFERVPTPKLESPIREIKYQFFRRRIPQILWRYSPATSFPAYAFVPGQHPHPRSDARGHSYNCPPHVPAPLKPEHPEQSLDFCFAIDLFNAGYYWEAHEIWEGLWIAHGRVGKVADFLKGLIKLAAAGVKAREGQATGVYRHAKRSLELLESIRDCQATHISSFCGIVLEPLMAHIRRLCEHPIVDTTSTVSGRAVLPIRLTLSHLDPPSQ